jgi:Uma2 family endonuclease
MDSVEEYLRMPYEPDMEYVDGELVDRNEGELQHGLVQCNVIFALRRKYPGVEILPGVTTKVTETRYRLPDVGVALSVPEGRFVTEAPYAAIEILSEEDRASRFLEKLQDYATMGVPNIWVFEPGLTRDEIFQD